MGIGSDTIGPLDKYGGFSQCGTNVSGEILFPGLEGGTWGTPTRFVMDHYAR